MGKKGGKMPGAGRPKGKLNQSTLDKLKVGKEVEQRILKNVEKIFNKQMMLVEGCSYLYRIDQDEKGKKKPAELVTDAEEIRMYLDDEVDTDSYYYITTERPSQQAIDSFMNRAFGKPKESIEHTGEGGGEIKTSLTISFK